MNITIEHPCPQCGGMVELGESDHILACPYCEVKSCLSTFMPALVLPAAKQYEVMVYAPYLRFRGSVYSCIHNTIEHQIIDTSLLAIPHLTVLPPSLGLRPQAMKHTFATTKLQGTFLKCLLTVDDALERAGTLQMVAKGRQLFHRACIGETISRIYQPLFLADNTLGDAITGKLLAKLPHGMDSLAKAIDPSPPLALHFLATLCPQCGWDLNSASDSVVMTCSNCNTAWEARGSTMSQVNFASFHSTEQQSIFLPFWKIEVNCRGITLDNFADFVQLANLPVARQAAWQQRKMSFWTPAFKVRPKIFLRLATRLTGSVTEMTGEERLPDRCHPVNLPQSEAVESLKVILTNSAANRKKILPLLPEISLTATSSTLFYLPFDDSGYDLRQRQTGIVLNKHVLAWGKFL